MLLLISQKDDFPIRSVVDILREKSHFLHEYLHNLYISDSERLPPEYHDLQVVLYANYDRSKLMEFLKTSPHYEERDALEVAEAKGEVRLFPRRKHKRLFRGPRQSFRRGISLED